MGRKPNYASFKSEIPEHVRELADNVDERLTKNFKKFVEEQNWRNVDTVKKLRPYVTSASHMTKLSTGERKVSLDLLVVLHEVYEAVHRA